VGQGDLDFFSDSSQNGETFKEPSEIFLENDDKDEQENGEEALENDRGQIKLKKPCNDIDESQEADADENEPGGPALEPDQNGRDHDGNNCNVKDILNPQVLSDCQDIVHHGLFTFRLENLHRYKFADAILQ